MTATVPFALLVPTFRAHVAPAGGPPGRVTVSEALQGVAHFFRTRPIARVDRTLPDTDLLLFEYGTYN